MNDREKNMQTETANTGRRFAELERRITELEARIAGKKELYLEEDLKVIGLQ